MNTLEIETEVGPLTINGVTIAELDDGAYSVTYPLPGQGRTHTQIYTNYAEAEANFARRVEEEDYR